MKRLLIAGVGDAGIACIEQLLKFNHQFRITVFQGPRQPGAGLAHGPLDVPQDILRDVPMHTPVDSGQVASGQVASGQVASGPVTMDTARLEWLRKNDVKVLPSFCMDAIDLHANVVRGCDRSRATFDTLILAAGGSLPALARAAGLEVRSGVVVNDFMEASDAHVYALGEGAEHRGSIYSDAETVEQQARVLASHLTRHKTARFVPPITQRSSTLTLLNVALLNAALLIPDGAVRVSAALPNACADSARRLVDQTPETANQIALAGAA